MKTLVFIILYFIISGTCRADSDLYTIIGTIEKGSSFKNDGYAIIGQMGKKGIEAIDTTEIHNNQFLFKGNINSTRLVNIYFLNKETLRPYTNKSIGIVLEKGNIKIQCKPNKNIISGTKHNDILNEINCKVDSFKQIISNARQTLNNTNFTEQQRQNELKNFRSLKMNIYEKVNSMYKSFIHANINNFVGYALFTKYYNSFSSQEQEILLSRIPEIYQNDSIIKNIQKKVETSKRTSIGKEFIDISMTTPEGKTLKLSDIIYNNKYTIIDFWASWCGPCRAEMPNLVSTYKKYKNKKIEIVGISLDNKKEDWIKAIKQLKLEWPQMSDLKGWNSSAAKLYNINGIPSTILINQQGIIIAKDLRGEQLVKELDKILQ